MQQTILTQAESVELAVVKGWFKLQSKVLPTKLQASLIYRKFSKGAYMFHHETLRSFSIKEASLEGATLVNLKGEKTSVKWINDKGKVDLSYLRDWSVAGRQTQILHQLSQDFESNSR